MSIVRIRGGFIVKDHPKNPVPAAVRRVLERHAPPAQPLTDNASLQRALATPPRTPR